MAKPRPRPLALEIDYDNRTYTYKCYLDSHSFSYRCFNHNTCDCKVLLTIPIDEKHYDLLTYKLIGVDLAKYEKEKERVTLILASNSIETKKLLSFAEWGSDIILLRDYIRENLTLTPITLQLNMKNIKQTFTIESIKRAKKDIWDEIYPREAKIAFHVNNCKIIEAKDSDDNLKRYYSTFPIETKKKGADNFLIENECYIFGTRMMLHQLPHYNQWFVDGTFGTAPSGYQQLLVVMVYIPIR